MLARQLLSVYFAGAAAAAMRPSRAPPSPMPISAGALPRRAALALPLALALGMPQRADAICSCPTGFASCVCTDDPPSSKASTTTIQRKRADAAGREAELNNAEIRAFRAGGDALTSDEAATTRAREKAAPKRVEISAGASDGPTMLGRGSLTGFGTQNFNEIDASGARKRFLEILSDTVAKREAEYGFELDAGDIKQIESVLRLKYCGKEGLIGPC